MKFHPFCIGALFLAIPIAPGQAQDDSDPARAEQAHAELLDLGLAGSGNGFQYEQIPTATNVYAVTVSNGSPVLISDSFLSLIFQSGMDAEVQQAALQQYPAMVQDNFATIMETTFPVKSDAPALPFAGIDCSATDGATMTIDQDDLAAPYVRIHVRDANGKTETFSINRTFVEGLLAQKETDGDKLLSSVTSFPFRLPEASRAGFAYLTREQMNDQVLHMEAFQNQEIVRMPRFYREESAEVLQAWSNRPRLAAPPVQMPAPATADRPTPASARRIKTAAGPAAPQPPPAVPAAGPAETPAPPSRNWPALAGWGVAALALVWAMLSRKR